MLEANPAFPKLSTHGMIKMREMTTSPLSMTGFVSRLPTPNTSYGFTINENGWYVSSERCEETGGHWNPTGENHGPMNGVGVDVHAGDIASIRASSYGTANYYAMAYKPTLWGENSIIGRSMNVYAEMDDFGRAGTEMSRENGGLVTPIACCHIKLVTLIKPKYRERTRSGDTERADSLESRRKLEDEDGDEVKMTPEEFAEVFGFMPDVDGDDGDLFFGQD